MDVDTGLRMDPIFACVNRNYSRNFLLDTAPHCILIFAKQGAMCSHDLGAEAKGAAQESITSFIHDTYCE